MTSGTNYRWVTAVIAALAAGLIAAIVIPRMTGDGEVNWIVTIVVALVVGVGVALATREKVDDGAHIRDDVLPKS